MTYIHSNTTGPLAMVAMRLLTLLVCAAVASVYEHDLHHHHDRDNDHDHHHDHDYDHAFKHDSEHDRSHDQHKHENVHVLEAISAIGHYEVVDMRSVRSHTTLSAGTVILNSFYVPRSLFQRDCL
jgi:ABC-type nickel/cobalt efflux system permease component RcnA